MSRIPPPSDDKQPVKRNIFEFLREANCTLIPLFPWFDAGSIVPAATLFEGGEKAYFGFFEHRNDVDEIFVCFASEGSRIVSGSVRVGQRQHFVGNPFLEGSGQDAFALVAIIQRQSEGREQTERVVFRCLECKTELLDREFDATPPPRGKQVDTLGPHAVFTTLEESLKTYQLYNERQRTCPKCGHENPPFPVERWGQNAYVHRSHSVRTARKSHEENHGG